MDIRIWFTLVLPPVGSEVSRRAPWPEKGTQNDCYLFPPLSLESIRELRKGAIQKLSLIVKNYNMGRNDSSLDAETKR